MPMLKLRTQTIALAGAAALAAGAVAGVATAADRDAQITVGPQQTLHAGQTAPFDAPGVKAIRRGKPIPSGYVLVSRNVTVNRGTAGSVGAAFKLTCPAGKGARTLALTGKIGPTVVQQRYEGHREVRVNAWSPPRSPNASGTSYLVCR
jgi:hypothetical protein